MFTVADADGDERDAVLHADAGATVSQVARLLGAEPPPAGPTPSAGPVLPAEPAPPAGPVEPPHAGPVLYAGPAPLDPESRLAAPGPGLAVAAIRDGCQVGVGRPVAEDARSVARADSDTVRLVPADDEPVLLVRRPPRLFPLSGETRFVMPPRPTVGLPLVMTGGLFSWLPVMIAGLLSWLPRRRRELRAWAGECARIEESAFDAVEVEEDGLRTRYPDPAAMYAIAAAPDSRLWERRPGDPDFLQVRIGTDPRRPSGVVLNGPPTMTRVLALHNVPRTIRLADPPADGSAGGGVLCVQGRTGMARAVCRWLVTQLAVLHSPEDVRICLLTERFARADWEWIRWLPHCRPPRGGTALAWIGNSAPTVSARIAELLGIIEVRRAAANGSRAVSGPDDPADGPGGAASGPTANRGRQDIDGPVVVAVFDDWRRVRSQPGITSVLVHGPEAGVHVICLDPENHGLPDNHPSRAGSSRAPGGEEGWPRILFADRLDQPDQRQPDRSEWMGRLPEFTDLPESTGLPRFTSPLEEHADRPPRIADGLPLESVDAAWCEQVARALAPLRDGDADRRRGVPDTSRLIDLLSFGAPMPTVIERGWEFLRGALGPGEASAVIGESADGPIGIDLRRDGPHGLIAGATGSGKTELLRTIVASFAVTSPPDEITFLLIDYKGSVVFRQFEDLPHTVGVIIDFDAHEGRRILTALAAELRRREAQLAVAGAKDIDDYAALRSRDPSLGPLPRLVIMADEIAGLALDFPDFLPGLVTIAQRGRSLGVHLILATQQPAVVTPEIFANVNLRIALRLNFGADSAAVIDAPDAAAIPPGLPGRGYIRFGLGLPTLVQFSQVCGTAPPEFRSPWLAPADWENLGEPEPPPPAEAVAAEPGTDLTALVAAIRQASESARIPPPHRPWLPGLPGTVLLGELKPPTEPGPSAEPKPSVSGLTGEPSLRPGELPLVPYAMEDLPAEHTQRAVSIDFGAFGHLLAVGDQRSGRAQLLRTIAGSVAATISCADVHLYGIGSPAGKLRPLAELPHCGAVATTADPGKVARLVGRLGRELDRRQELLAETRHRGIGDQRADSSPPQRLPHILILIDRWESFTDAIGEVRYGTLIDTVTRIARGGPRLGMHLVVTGGQAALRSPLGGPMEEKLAFRLTDRAEYAAIGLRPRNVPEAMPEGRALRSGSGTEVQVALLDGEPTGAGQVAALRRIAEAARRRDADVPRAQRPFGIEAAELVSDRFHVGDTQGRPVGREDILAWLRARHAAGGSVALLGPRRAGKTWVLRELEHRLGEDGRRRVRGVTIQLPSSQVATPDELARILDLTLGGARYPARRLLDAARDSAGGPDRITYLLDEVGRLAAYGPAAVSWLRDLGQAGAWLVYTGTEKDWQEAVRQALKAPGSSFGNDVDARMLGPIDERDAITFLTGTAANLRVSLSDEMAARVVSLVGAWPFYLQVMGDAIVRAAQAGDPGPLRDDRALRDLIDARLLDGWMTHFQGRWTEIGPAGRSALLTQPGEPPGDLAPGQREDLRNVGLLLPGDRWLADRPFFDWVARNATALRDGERR